MKRILHTLKIKFLSLGIVKVCGWHKQPNMPIGLRSAILIWWYDLNDCYDYKHVSHGICKRCHAKVQAEMDKKFVVKPASPRNQIYERNTLSDMVLRYLSGGHLQ